VSNRNDSLLRRTNLALLTGASAQLYRAGYGFDAAGRLDSVNDGTNSATYSYLANSPLVSQITFKSNSTVRLTTTKTHDFLNRLARIDHSNSVAGLVGVSSYAYNTANQRTSVTNLDGSYWAYQYDSLGQVTSGRKYWANGTAVLGQQFDYTFDDIGNRKTAVTGGNEWGSNQRYQNYTANTLNQYTQRTVPGYVDVLGSASTGATVTVNYQPATRQGEYWRRELGVDNVTNALWLPLTNYAAWPQGGTGDFVTNTTGNAFVPKTPEAFSHDADGNLTNDGRWAYVWNGENRLLSMTGPSTAPSGSRKALHFDYDPQGRRITKVVSNWTGSVWTRVLHEKYFYDGWNLLAALNGTNDALVRSFTWGSDLSGSMQGAGGVGGLLLVRDTANGTHFCGHDGNGNVTLLVNTQTGTNSATYEYGPFGENLRATGPMAKANSFRFSSKFQDDESDLLYYGYRYYSAITGRWLSRDPLGERGGNNTYAFVNNLPVSLVDALGLRPISVAFNAFIPGRLKGSAGDNWLPEPLPGSPWYFHGDERSFGGGSSRLHAEATIESTKIGKNPSTRGGSRNANYPHKFWSDPSERRKLINGSWFYDAPATATAGGSCYKDDYRCRTELRFISVHAAYGYHQNSSPDIDFTVTWTFEVVAKSKVKVTVSGSHNRFPNYEGIVDSGLIYTYDTPLSGPGLINLNTSVSFTSRSILLDAETPACCP
jgi:RHS repeat-associated protein